MFVSVRVQFHLSALVQVCALCPPAGHHLRVVTDRRDFHQHPSSGALTASASHHVMRERPHPVLQQQEDGQQQDYASVLSRAETTFQMGSSCSRIIACHCSLLHFVFLLELLCLFPFFISWNNTKNPFQKKLPEELQPLVVLLVFSENFLPAYNS